MRSGSGLGESIRFCRGEGIEAAHRVCVMVLERQR